MATVLHTHGHLRNALKIVLVGDPEVGKTWLLSRSHELYATFSDDGYSLFKKPFVPPEEYSPTVFESYFTNVDTSDLGNYQTNMWDTGGWWIFNSVRPLTYVGADAIMLCFDVTNRESFYNITESWLPEVQKYQPGIPVLLVGTKGDLRAENESELKNLVLVSEAEAAAEKMGARYQETSAQTGEHVNKAFGAAVKLGHTYRVETGGKECRKRSRQFKHVDSAWLPPISSPPAFKTELSTHAKDFKEILKDVANADILFTFEDGSESISAHKIVLWLSPSAFRDALREKNTCTFKKFKDIFEVKEMSADLFQLGQNDNAIPKASQIMTCVVLKNWISRETLITILEFLYTGEAGISQESEHGKIKKVLTAAEKLKVCALVDICKHLLKCKGDKKKTDTENKSTGLAPRPPRLSVHGLFLDKEATPFSDVKFLVEDKLVFAHKAVLAARSPVLAALLSENFRDGKSSQIPLQGVDHQSFLAVLEYLYTDRFSSLDKSSIGSVLVLADRLCLQHLVQICEAEIQNGLQLIIPSEIDKDAATDLMDLFAFSKMFNAKQLTEWCLYFIALNLTRLQGISKELDSVVAENSQFIEKHSGPLHDYLRILEGKPKQTTKERRQLHRKATSCLPHQCNIL
ncbi:rho-related protein racA-like isoform X2 [Oculina patagonica]